MLGREKQKTKKRNSDCIATVFSVWTYIFPNLNDETFDKIHGVQLQFGNCCQENCPKTLEQSSEKPDSTQFNKK